MTVNLHLPGAVPSSLLLSFPFLCPICLPQELPSKALYHLYLRLASIMSLIHSSFWSSCSCVWWNSSSDWLTCLTLLLIRLVQLPACLLELHIRYLKQIIQWSRWTSNCIARPFGCLFWAVVSFLKIPICLSWLLIRLVSRKGFPQIRKTEYRTFSNLLRQSRIKTTVKYRGSNYSKHYLSVNTSYCLSLLTRDLRNMHY